jgi:hypothetical protein
MCSRRLRKCATTKLHTGEGSIDIPVRWCHLFPVGLPATDNKILDDVETLVINNSGLRRNFWYRSLKDLHRSITRPSVCCCCVLSCYLLNLWCLATNYLLDQLWVRRKPHGIVPLIADVHWNGNTTGICHGVELKFAFWIYCTLLFIRAKFL